MAITYKKLGNANGTLSSMGTLYTVPLGTASLVKSINITNTSSSLKTFSIVLDSGQDITSTPGAVTQNGSGFPVISTETGTFLYPGDAGIPTTPGVSYPNYYFGIESNDDDNYIVIPTPFPIYFLGNSYNQVCFSTNGYITFESPSSAIDPGSNLGQPAIMFTGLSPDKFLNYYKYDPGDGTYFTITWFSDDSGEEVRFKVYASQPEMILLDCATLNADNGTFLGLYDAAGNQSYSLWDDVNQTASGLSWIIQSAMTVIANEAYLAKDVPIAGNETVTIKSGITLDSGKILKVYASSDNLIRFNAYGAEIA